MLQLCYNYVSYILFRLCVDTVTNYNQQDAIFLEFISNDALHVSGGSSAHHQEHITVHTASGIPEVVCIGCNL